MGTPDGGFWHAKDLAVKAEKYGVQTGYRYRKPKGQGKGQGQEKGKDKGTYHANRTWKYSNIGRVTAP